MREPTTTHMLQTEIDEFRRELQSKLDEKYFTDDMPYIGRYASVPVFVYGTLKRNFPLHRFLATSPCLGMAHTMDRNYVMFETATGKYPIVMDASDSPDVAGAIVGEVYMVRPDILAEIDFLESQGHFYHRRLINVKFNDFGAMNGKEGQAYIYIGDEETWLKRYEVGDITDYERFTRKKDPSYHYYYWRNPSTRKKTEPTALECTIH
jgi:gamma-glutamylcyclotransferase (GGCT)/AIG2-like uncharacterized protein YtfP